MAFTKIAAAGIGSTELVTLHSLEVLNNATVGGVLTYEDVTNVDSIGIITARAGVLVGSGITLSKDGDIFATGVTTTGSLVSSGTISGTTGTFSSGISITGGDLTIPDAIIHDSDTNTRIRFPASDTFTVETAGNERLRIDSAGRVLIGGTSAVIASGDEFNEIVLTGKTRGAGITLQDTDANTRFQIRTDDAGGDPQTLLNASTNHPIVIRTNNTEVVRIDSSGRLLLGHTASVEGGSSSLQAKLQVSGTDFNSSAINLQRYQTNASAAVIAFSKSRNATQGSHTVLQDNDEFGKLIFYGSDGNDFQNEGARITAQVDGTPGNNDMPGSLSFKTTTQGAVGSSERLRIKSDGSIQLTSENTTGWSLDAGDNSASYTAIDDHFPTTNRTLYINNETTHRSIAFWNKNGSDGYGFGLDNSGNFKVVYGTNERLRIVTQGGQILTGHNTKSTNFHDPQTTTDRTPHIQIHGGNSVHASAALVSWSSNAGAYYSNALYLAHSGSNTIGTNSIVSTSNTLGSIVFSGDDGDEFVKGAMISARVDGTPGADDMPTRLSFFTTPENSDTPTEKVRITQDGKVSMGNPASGSPNRLLYVDTGTTGDGMRITSDEVLGDLVINNTGDGHGRSFVINASRTDNGTLPKLHLAGQGSITFAVDANSTRMTIDANGNIGAPSGNNIYNASDERLKENIVELTDGLSKVKQLKPVSFTWKDGWSESLEGVTQYGFGAQTTQAVDELLVEPFSSRDVELNGETIENPLRVNEKHIIPLLVKAIQELSAKNDALETRIAALEG